jgi:hypothetical protein
MAKKLTITTKRDGKTNQKYEVKGTVNINETEILSDLFKVIDTLSEYKISNLPENGGFAISQNEFVHDAMCIIESGGKLQVNITIE